METSIQEKIDAVLSDPRFFGGYEQAKAVVLEVERIRNGTQKPVVGFPMRRV